MDGELSDSSSTVVVRTVNIYVLSRMPRDYTAVLKEVMSVTVEDVRIYNPSGYLVTGRSVWENSKICDMTSVTYSLMKDGPGSCSL